MTLTEKVEQCLESIRPALAMHDGNVELVSIDEEQGIATVNFLGGCKGCPMSQVTLKMGIEAEILAKVPEINEVRAVGVDDAESEEGGGCGCGDGHEDGEGCCTDDDAWFNELLTTEKKKDDEEKTDK